MSRPRRNDFLVPTLGVLFDAIAIEGAFLFSYWLRFETPIFDVLPIGEQTPPLDAYVFGSFAVLPIWLLVFKSRGMYGARRNVALTDEFVDVLRVVTLGMLIVMSAAFFYRAFSYSRIVFGLLWVNGIVLIYAGRVALHYVEITFYRRGKELRNAVIVGSNEAANRIARTIRAHPLLGYRLIGYFADQPDDGSAGIAGEQYLGPIAAASTCIADRGVELAFLTLNHDEHDKLYCLMQECEGVNVEFLLVPDILELMTSRLSMREIDGIPFIKIKGMPMTTWGRILKRSFDFIVSVALLLCFAPVFLLVAILIRHDSRGPVFYKQERVGLDGRCFRMLKFRSMRVDAEQETGPVWARDDDPRRTRFGAFLRRTSIDELPQLLNVLKGEMSLVGPRPERPFFVYQFSQRTESGKPRVPKYLDRHRVRTGITGWAQVNGLRGNTSLEERIKYDVYYVENWSLGFDLLILAKTLGALFGRDHARS